MAGKQARSRKHRSIRDNQRKFRTRSRVKDLDQIHTDIAVMKSQSTIDSAIGLTFGKFYKEHDDDDIPGSGEHYCVECSKHFIDSPAMESHVKSKDHKRRVKLLQNELPYSQAEAERAAGLGA